MNYQNVLFGLGMILVALLPTLIPFLFRKKKSFLNLVLMGVILTWFVANVLQGRVPDGLMPHNLGCMENPDNYIWDKNMIRDITVILSSIIGMICYVCVCGSKIKQKEDTTKYIVTLALGLIIFLFLGFVMRGAYAM